MWQPGVTLEQLEKETIYKALKFFNNNKVHTARALGISERTLYNKLELYEGNANANSSQETKLGIQLEPAQEISAKQSVPLRKSEEIQEMPPRSSSGSNHHQGSKKFKSAR